MLLFYSEGHKVQDWSLLLRCQLLVDKCCRTFPILMAETFNFRLIHSCLFCVQQLLRVNVVI